MSSCGCTVRWPVCAAGRQLWIDVQCGAGLVESPSFVSRAMSERDAAWEVYNAAVVDYLRHCGYLTAAPGGGVSRHARG